MIRVFVFHPQNSFFVSREGEFIKIEKCKMGKLSPSSTVLFFIPVHKNTVGYT
jgi:hypothetical protein